MSVFVAKLYKKFFKQRPKEVPDLWNHLVQENWIITEEILLLIRYQEPRVKSLLPTTMF